VKYLVLLGDGMADWPLAAYGGRTPLEVAHTPSMDRIASLGILGQFCPIPEGLPAGSDIGNLSLFGYDPRTSFCGRAPIEAARQGIALSRDQVAFRCNLVTLSDGRMRDFTAGHISTDEGAALISALNAALGREFGVSFYPGVSYRHLTIATASPGVSVDDLVSLECTPPHDITGQAWAAHLPRGVVADWAGAMIQRSQALLPDHPVNRRRCAEGKPPATSAWFWGQGKTPSMESYRTKFGITGAVISAVDLVNGIGVLAGLEVISVPGATGWIDTNYEGKIGAALAALGRHDFVYVHVEAPDETGHQGRADLKIQAIEDFDRRIVAPALAYYAAHPETRLLVAPDHFTVIETKTHAGGPLPFAICGAGITPNGFREYSERAAAETGVLLEEGFRLTQKMLRDPVMILPDSR